MIGKDFPTTPYPTHDKKTAVSSKPDHKRGLFTYSNSKPIKN